jgi:hypothetical protein
VIVKRQTLDRTALIHLHAQYFSSRYEREQKRLVLTTSALALPFGKTDVAAGGVQAGMSFAAPSYALHISTDPTVLGEVCATYTRTGSERVGTLTGTVPAGIADGPVFLTLVGAANESSGTLGAYLDRQGQAKDSRYTIVQSYSYDWYLSKGQHVVALVEKSLIGSTTPAIVPRTPEFFTAPLASSQIVRVDRVANYHVPHRPNVDARGIMTTACPQPYDWAPLIAPTPALPLRDGPRGVGTCGYVTFLRTGRNGKAYFCDPWRFGVVDTNGSVKTLLGLRHAVDPYWEDAPSHEVVGR